MSEDLRFYLKSLARLIYFQTDEEDRFLLKLKEYVKKPSMKIKVFNPTMGLQDIDTVIGDWTAHKNPENKQAFSIDQVLEVIYKDEPKDENYVYVVFDAERYLTDANNQNAQNHRRLLNLVHSLRNDIRTVKMVIFVGHRRVIPEKLSRYFEVVQDKGLTTDEVEGIVSTACKHLDLPAPPNVQRLFKGMTGWEIEASIAQSVVKSKETNKHKPFIDPSYIIEYRRRALRKTDLLSYVDTKHCSFEDVGGQVRFKEWCQRTRACWDEKGRAFGLTPPKGVLAVGVWGCGKSISVKAMGHAWNLPVVQLEMGKFRSGQVGQSEANVYAAINLIERISPCIVWIDEAEKSLSGGQSSAATDSGTTSRMIGIFSTWLQETNAPVTLALTANSLATLPIEFVNRMDERFFFDLPSEKERIEIIKIHIAKLGRDPKSYNLAALAEKGEMLVGREIEQAVKAALRDSFFAGKSDLDEEILAKELEKKPRISRTMADEIQNLITWVGYDPEADDGIRAKYASPPTKREQGGGGLSFG